MADRVPGPAARDYQIGQLLASRAAQAEWDSPPAVYLILLRDGVPSLLPHPVLVEPGDIPRPREVIRAVAAAFSDMAAFPGYRPPPGLYGAAVRFEAWILSSDDTGEDEFHRHVAAGGPPRSHPCAVETRLVYGVCLDGRGHGIAMQRALGPAGFAAAEVPVGGLFQDIVADLCQLLRAISPGAGAGRDL